MFNKKGQVGGAEEMAGSTVLEMIGLIVLFVIIGHLVWFMFFESSIDQTSLDSFNRLDRSIRNMAADNTSNGKVPISLDSDYALVVYDNSEGIENPQTKAIPIWKPISEEKCGNKACLCICENSHILDMCLMSSSECTTYEFGFTNSQGFFVSGKDEIISLNLKNVENNIQIGFT